MKLTRALMLIFCVMVFLTGCETNSGQPVTEGIGGAPDDVACAAPDPSDEAQKTSGKQEDGSAILLNGRRITPPGDTVLLDVTAPWWMKLNHAGTWAFATSPHGELMSINLETMDVTYKRFHPAVNDMVITADDSTMYLGGGASEQVRIIDLTDPANPAETGTIDLQGGYIAGLALTTDEATLVAVDSSGGNVVIINTADKSYTKIKVGYYPREVILSPDESLAFVANMGGNSVAIVDMTTKAKLSEIAVGKLPRSMALNGSGSKLYVANSDDSTISVIDVTQKKLEATVDIDKEHPELKALKPTGVYYEASSSRLYVACANMNALYVMDTTDPALGFIGAIPTGAYPDVMRPLDGGNMVVLNSYGWGGLPNFDPRESPDNSTPGSLSKFQMPTSDDALAQMTQQVQDNNNRPLGFYGNTDCQRLIPLDENGENPIKHVVLIVKENKTYDEILGDLKDANGQPWGNGDPAITLFGEKITPNAHELARQFTTSDNFYTDAEVSLQGHVWTTHADCNDYTNKMRHDQLAVGGVEPTARPGTMSIFQLLKKQGISFRNYGEGVAFVPEFIDEMRDYIDPKVSFYNQAVSDVAKGREVAREIENGIFPSFVYISLPNDHTYGGDAGKPTPTFMVADNDYGMATVVEAISNSPYWENTIIFVTQDDAQSASGDHVDAHRTVFWAISPWVKRGYMSHVHYSNPALYRTIEMLLGIPHLNRNTAMATPMYDMFTDTPDYTPYTAIRPDVAFEVNGSGTKADRDSSKFNLEIIDGHKGLGDIIWNIMRPGQERPSYVKRLDE